MKPDIKASAMVHLRELHRNGQPAQATQDMAESLGRPYEAVRRALVQLWKARRLERHCVTGGRAGRPNYAYGLPGQLPQAATRRSKAPAQQVAHAIKNRHALDLVWRRV